MDTTVKPECLCRKWLIPAILLIGMAINWPDLRTPGDSGPFLGVFLSSPGTAAGATASVTPRLRPGAPERRPGPALPGLLAILGARAVLGARTRLRSRLGGQAARRRCSLRKREVRFRTVAENAYDWERWDAPGGAILYCSPSCERITGLPAERFEQDPGLLRRIIHPDDYPLWSAHHDSVHQQAPVQGPVPGPSPGAEFRIVHADGSVRWVEHACHPIYDADGAYQGRRVRIRDITDWKGREQERTRLAALDRFHRTQKAIIECNQAIIRAQSEEDLLQEFCRISMNVHGVHQVWVGLVGPGGVDSLWLAAHIGFPAGAWSRAWNRDRLAVADDPMGQGPAEVAIRTGEVCIQGNPSGGSDLARGDGDAPRSGTRSSIALPLLSGPKPFGVLVLSSVHPGNFTEASGTILLDLANNLAIGILDLRTRAERDRALRTAEHQTALLRSLAMELTQAEQRERQRLAQVLHDHLQQLLVGATLSVEALRSQAPSARKDLDRLTGTLQEALHMARLLAVELSPPVVREKPLHTCMEWLARDFGRRHGLKVALDLVQPESAEPEPARRFIFEAVRELLLNVVKHSGTRAVRLRLRSRDDGRLEVTVADEGAGFDPACLDAAVPGEGIGLSSLRQRLRFLGGGLEIQSRIGGGSRFTLTVPVQGWPDDRAGRGRWPAPAASYPWRSAPCPPGS